MSTIGAISNKIVAEIFLNVRKEMSILLHEAHGTANTQYQKRNYLHHITVKGEHTEENVLRTPRQRIHLTYKGKPIRVAAYFSIGTLKIQECLGKCPWNRK